MSQDIDLQHPVVEETTTTTTKKKAVVEEAQDETEPLQPSENQESELFDASKKKKKKKKKVSEEVEEVAREQVEGENEKLEDELGELSLTKKKKKKKKTTSLVNEEEQTVVAEEAEQQKQQGDEGVVVVKKKKKKKKKEQSDEQQDDGDDNKAGEEEANVEEQGAGELLKKKKKKKKRPVLEDELQQQQQQADGEEEVVQEEDSGEGGDAPVMDLGANQSEKEDSRGEHEDSSTPQMVELSIKRDGDFGPESWTKSDRDYKYPELLDRIITQLKKKNPELSVGKKKKIRMKPPQVARDGPKKTVFLNFEEICKNLHRQQDHVLHFLMSELGTTGNLDSGNRLIMRSVFQGKDIESVLRNYISKYVLCQDCGSLDTLLTRDPNTRLYSLNCMNCGASRTVQTVKQGFVANFTPRRHRQ